MKACTKCGRRHNDVETLVGRQLYCDDIKKFWSFVGGLHREKTAHFAHADIDPSGNWYCLRCGQPLDVGPNTVRKWVQESDALEAELRTKQDLLSTSPAAGCKEESQ